jgi:CheY-like chemotaxis protein
LADTAGTLGLGQLERAARAAARDIPLGRRVEALRLVAQALRRTRGVRRLGPILVVASNQTASALISAMEVCSESVRVYPTMQAFNDALHVDEPTAVCLPVEAFDAVRQLAEFEQFPVLVHGPSADVEGLARAMAAGAAGYLPRPIDPQALVHQARWRSTHHDELMEVFLLMDASPVRDQLVSALESIGLRVTASAAPGEIGPALDEGHLDAVIMGA